MKKLLAFASAFDKVAGNDTHRWASGIVDQAFQREMGRAPSPAERQIVMAVALHESGYGQGWGKGNSSAGVGSHNWGAVQTTSDSVPSFSHGDSSAEGKYVTKFRAYPDDISGAADVVRILFKGTRQQREPDPNHKQRAMGKVIPGPGRGELIQAAAQQGDTMAFSKAMWYTSYYEGVGADFTKRIQSHADSMQSKVSRVASALGESPAWSKKSTSFLPVTSDQGVIDRINQMTGSTGYAQPQVPQGGANKPHVQPSTPVLPTPQTPKSDPFSGIESMLWFK